jgi:hypothetical protein
MSWSPRVLSTKFLDWAKCIWGMSSPILIMWSIPQIILFLSTSFPIYPLQAEQSFLIFLQVLSQPLFISLSFILLFEAEYYLIFLKKTLNPIQLIVCKRRTECSVTFPKSSISYRSFINPSLTTMSAVKPFQQVFWNAEVPMQVTQTHERVKVLLHLFKTSVLG